MRIDQSHFANLIWNYRALHRDSAADSQISPKAVIFARNCPPEPQNHANPEVSSGGLPILLCMFQKKIYL
jgi:hypothetical protein